MSETVSKEKLLEQAKRYVDEGRIDRAIQEYQKIIAVDPRDYRVLLRIAELHVRLKQVTEAVRVFQEVANAYAEEGFYLKAVTVYKNILRLNPSLNEVNERLAELYEKMGLAQDAIHQYQILAHVCEQKGDHKNILDIRRRIVMLDPTNVTNRVRLAESYQVEGQEQASLQEYETLAEQLKEGGSTDQLIDLYEKILSRRVDNLDLLRRLCRIYYHQADYKKALRRMEASQGIVGKDTELLEMQAESYARLNQMETAKGKWRELAELLHAQKQADKALAACERILVASPEEAEELALLIEGIRPGALQEVKERAERQRHHLAKEEAAREALEAARQTAAEQIAVAEKPVPGKAAAQKAPITREAVAPRESAVPFNAGDTEGLMSRARASEGLAKMYEQMGLQEEASAEIVKALEAYRRLLVAGAGGTLVLERVRELEQVVPGGTGPPAEAAPPPVAKREPAPKPTPKPAATGVTKAALNTSVGAPPAGSDKKKRISFV